MDSSLIIKWAGAALTVGEVGVVETGVVGGGTTLIVHDTGRDLQVVTGVVRDQLLAGEVHPGCRHLQTQRAAVIVDVVDVADRVVGMRWMILRRRWRR